MSFLIKSLNKLLQLNVFNHFFKTINELLYDVHTPVSNNLSYVQHNSNLLKKYDNYLEFSTSFGSNKSFEL